MSQPTRQASKSLLLLLPNELLQSIYLHCLEPNLALASGLLGAALSSETLLQATLFQAFWSPDPLEFRGVDVQPIVKLPRYSLLARSAHLSEQTPEEREKMQRLILAQRWPTFTRLRKCFSQLLAAACYDLFKDINLSLTFEDQLALDDLIENPPHKCTVFTATSLDGSKIVLNYYWPLARNARLTYTSRELYTGHDPRFNWRCTPNLEIEPTIVMTLPDACLQGAPWTHSKIQKLRMLSYGMDMKDVTYSSAGFHAGMKNAVLERDPTALLVLAWVADRIFAMRKSSHHDTPFELPQDIFRSAISSSTEDNESADAITISIFKILLRTHAESMPKSDDRIVAWATHLLSRPSSQAFGQWLLDFSSRPEENEYIIDTGRWGFGLYGIRGDFDKVRRPLFQGGDFSYMYQRSGHEVMESWVVTEGGMPGTFEHDVGNIGSEI